MLSYDENDKRNVQLSLKAVRPLFSKLEFQPTQIKNLNSNTSDRNIAILVRFVAQGLLIFYVNIKFTVNIMV